MAEQLSEKSTKFRDKYLSLTGSIIDVHQGDKLFIETRIFRTSEPSDENINVIVKSIVKSVKENSVTIENVETLGVFKDPIKHNILKEIDQSKFQSQFRQKDIQLLKNGNWGIVPSKTKSGRNPDEYDYKYRMLTFSSCES